MTNRAGGRWIFFPAAMYWIVAAHCAAAAEHPFEKDIRPILRERCVRCHGPELQKGGLRLDARAFAFRGGDAGPVIVPGKANESSFIERILSEDPEVRMPSEGKPLTPAEIARLKTWIEQGADWPETDADRAAARDPRLDHWAVQPIRAAVVPHAGGAAALNVVDAWIAAALAEKKLQPLPAADRRTLLRRLKLDLHGLPPTGEEWSDFQQDERPDAYERLVDRLLASPRFGERWAQHWLDIAHYADTHGFERDQRRDHAWRFRDYVIRAVNDDRPYDQFVREQIAGDVLYPEHEDAVVATGFLAAGPFDFVGQVETQSDVLRRAARADDLDDIVMQVITATMGVTINCARCHDHKIDPIKQEEYYRLWSVFAGVKRGDRDLNPAVTARAAEDRQTLQRRLQEIHAELNRLQGNAFDLADVVGGGDGRGTGIKNAGLHPATGKPTSEKLAYHRDLPLNRFLVPDKTFAPESKFRFVAGLFIPQGGLNEGAITVAGGKTLRDIPATAGHSWDILRNGPLNAQVHAKADGVDFAAEGHSVLGLHASGGVMFDVTEIRRATGWKGLRFTATVAFGSGDAAGDTRAGYSVYIDEKLAARRLDMKKKEFASLDLDIPPDAELLTLLATDGGDGIAHDLLFFGDARLRSPETSPPQTEDQQRIALLRQEQDQLKARFASLPKSESVFAAISVEPPPIKLLRRGNPEDPQQEVTPGAFGWVRHQPADFGDRSSAAGARRAALAGWITHPDNPLTRRVFVNRLWHHHFGQGLVNTPSDFGLGGDRPSHPGLLDTLAEELRAREWSAKAVHRLICTSAAYRRASLAPANDPAVAVDAGNRLLWRQNPRRLDAESLRDAVTAAAGTLNLAMGGPGYRDFNYREEYAPVYTYITPDRADLWRRSVYRFKVRTTPQPLLSVLDCPNPANLTPARINTTTALQALTLINNEFMLQQADYLANEVRRDSPDAAGQIGRAFARTLLRPPTATEADAAQALVAAHGLPALCRMLLNANEFLYVD